MTWYLIIGVALTGWTLLLLLASERQRRLNELETKHQQIAAALARQQKVQRYDEIPVVG